MLNNPTIYRSQSRFILESIEGMLLLLLVFCSWPVSKHWLKQWGSRSEERERNWLGDELVSSGYESYTRAINIAAPTNVVWKWVVQFGLGRAGFYSYELLERLAGIPVKNVESIVPALQSLSVGDEIRLHPKSPGIPVAMLETGRHVCFGKQEGSDHSSMRADPRRSWSIYVEPTPPHACRLLVRGCIERLREPTWPKRLALALGEPVDFVMEQRMLRTIQRLAESSRI